MECEICGREGGDILAMVEGAKLYVCHGCSSGAKIISMPRQAAPARQNQAGGGFLSSPASKTELEVVDDFGSTIRRARERYGLSLAVVAERLNEKESFLDRIEKETARPSEGLARKLEHELGIKLLEQVESSSFEFGGKSGKGMTLGDVLEIEKKKKR
ncbi:TIGR00270 family protein [Candidatus Parvarchaeota archaeon]|nr:TIGR00270 family protein [Candidatus Parvarchaeota archaeon]